MIYINFIAILRRRKRIIFFKKNLFRLACTGLLAMILIISQAQLLYAFEAHVINVTAEIVNDVPEINPPGGRFCSDDSVSAELTVTLAGAEIYYTIDGSDPICGDHGILYENPFAIYSGAIVKARSCHGGKQSIIMSWVFDFSKDYCHYEDFLKINKVYYDVDGEHGEEYYNEWVEIYNPADIPIDISGWIIGDNGSEDIIPASGHIPAHGFAVITGSSTTWGYWDIPAEVIKIVLPDGKIGNGLANNGDRVILKKPDGTEVDAMSYGSDIYGFNPACPDVAEGHMLGRQPNGYDTNQASDWKDFALPDVTVIIPNGGETWWVGGTYTIEWTAANHNGDDSDLTVDIYYSADSGATWANIVKGTENDGKYSWKTPLFLDGYYVPSSRARVKVAATDHTKNFMLTSWDMSDADFCPPIDYDLITPEELKWLEENGLLDNSAGQNDSGGNGGGASQNNGLELGTEPAGDNTASSTDNQLNSDSNAGEQSDEPANSADEPAKENDLTGDTDEDSGEPDNPDGGASAVDGADGAAADNSAANSEDWETGSQELPPDTVINIIYNNESISE